MMAPLKRLQILFLLVIFPILAVGQELEIEPINFKKIKKEIKKKKSAFYYPAMYQRYLDLDTSLTALEFKYLYFGYSFQDTYQPYAVPALRDSLINYLQRPEPLPQEIEMSAKIAGQLLRESPFRLRETFIAAVAYEMAGNEQMSAIYFSFFERQVEAIMSSGDGLSKKSAFIVIYIPDEYEILEVLGFNFGGNQSLIEGNYDLLQVEANPYGVTEIFFDVNRLVQAGFED
jgi:hypothetical protein